MWTVQQPFVGFIFILPYRDWDKRHKKYVSTLSIAMSGKLSIANNYVFITGTISWHYMINKMYMLYI